MDDNDYNEDLSVGYHGIPDARQREAMSVLQLAEEMVKHKEGSPPYIVLSHELNLKLAKLQAKATLSAGWVGAVATVVAAFISFAFGYFIGTSSAKELEKPAVQPTAVSGNKQQITPTPTTKNAQRRSQP